MTDETIFTQAVALKTPGEREAYLDQVCAGNPAQRAEVEALLKADADAGSFLIHPPAGADATIAMSADHDTVDSNAGPVSLAFLLPCDTPGRLGKLVGKGGEYEVIEIVGQGGMGAVVRAFDVKLSRIVAVKIMAPELAANPMAVKRFLREAKTAAAIHHEHVVTIHAIEEAHRPPFLVMQFVEGQNLQQKLDREGALDLKQILRIGSQMAAGLAAAHKQGLIHRDVKPANILLENGVERVKITDFGLARAADDLEMTQAGLIAGTPQYMSPEQAKGEPVDARSDLFSLGSVLYTMCTGRPGFRAETTMGVLKRVCEESPRPIRELNAEIPPWLGAIVNKLLAKNPADRFQSAAEVAELLGQHLAHEQNPSRVSRPATVAFPVTPTQSAKADPSSGHLTTYQRHLRSLLVATAICGALALVAGVITFILKEAMTPRQGRTGSITLPGDWPNTWDGLARLAGKPAGFVPLFNGQDLTGWKSHPDSSSAWTVKENMLVGSGVNQYLFTERGDFADFHLRGEVKINAQGDGGILVRMAPPAVPPAAISGYEVQLVGDPNHVSPTASIIPHCGDANSRGAKGRGDLTRPGEWFTLEIIAIGSRIAVAIDGRQVVDFVGDMPRKSGHIALQSYAAGTEISFRKIEIQELSPTAKSAMATRIARLDPAKDKPISAEYTDAGADGWLFTADEWKGFRLLEVKQPDLENCRLIARFRMKSEGAREAYPRLIARFAGDTAKDTIGKHNIAAKGDTNWTTYEVTLDLQPGEKPDMIEFGLHMEGRRTSDAEKRMKNQVWIKDVELLKAPLADAQTQADRAAPEDKGQR